MASLLFWLLTLVVCLAPLPFGGNQPWAWSGLALATGLLATLWGAASLADRRLVTMRRWRTLPYAGAFLLLALWYGLQASSLTPAGWHHEAWREAAAALEAPAGGSLSLTPDRTLTTLMRLATYAGIFWLAVHLLRSRRRARQFLWALSLAGAAYAADPVKVEVEGEASAAAGLVDGDAKGDANATLKVKGSSLLDNGIEIGAGVMASYMTLLWIGSRQPELELDDPDELQIKSLARLKFIDLHHHYPSGNFY